MAEKENLLVNLNDITEKEASWLVPQRMPKGQIIILAGDGGSGKTNAWCALAAAISSGKQELGDSMNAYYATQTLLVNMFRANSEPIWKISKQTETVMRKILSQ